MTFDVLLAKAAEFDFGAFVFSPDDIVKMDSAELTTTRDNVLFEFGLFASRLGRERVFIIMPNTSVTKFHVPSDLAGLTAATLDERRLHQGDNPQAFLGPACQKIRTVIVGTWGESAILTPDLVLLLRYLDRDFNLWLTSDQYARDVAVANGAPERVDAALAKAWQRAIRYGLMCLYLEGFARRRVDTSVTYSISQKGRRILLAPKVQQQFHETFNKELRPLSGQPWGDGQAPIDALRLSLSGNDHRLLFAVNNSPGQPPTMYEHSLIKPNIDISERVDRLTKLGLLLQQRGELHLTLRGHNLVGPVRAVAEHVYGFAAGRP
jgi:Predicted nucleotide-binding protein containing TIR-like domain